MTVPGHAHDPRSSLHDWRVAAEPHGAAGGRVRRHETPFVGREDLLHRFHQIVAQASAPDRLVVSVTGETGIGKTRLLHELADRGARLGLDVRWLGEPPTPAPARAAYASRPRLVLADLSSAADRLPEVATLAPDDRPDAPVLTFLALGPTAGAAGRPARRLLAGLARRRVLLEMPLPPLAEAELFELTSHLLGGPPNPRLHETISSLSEGNPFLAEELAIDLVQQGLVACEHGIWYLLSSVPAGYVPESVVLALSFELDALDPDALQTLASAAVLGPGFRFDVLAAALASPGDRLLVHLEAGLAAGIVREAAAPPDDFQFTHELARRVLYRRLSGIRRRRLHQAIAEALEQQGPRAGQADLSDALAYHFTRGVDRSRALGHILRAQERAEHLQAWDDAIRYCREGLDLVRQSDPADLDVQLDLLERLGALYFGQAQTFATGACWREAFHLCEQAGAAVSPLRRAALAARLAALGPSWYDVEAAEVAIDGALAAAASAEPHEVAWRVDAYHELGLAHQRSGRLAVAERYLRMAQEAADPVDWPRGALARVTLAGTLITAGRPAEAVERLRDALQILDERSLEELTQRYQLNHLRDPRRIHCRALGELVRALTCLGRLDEAARLVPQAHDEEIQFGAISGRAQRVAAQLELARGQPGRALQILESRMRQLASGTLSAVRVADLLLLAEAQLMKGDAAQAIDTAAEGVRLCQRSHTQEHLAGLHIVEGGALLARHEPEQALAAVALARATIERTGAELYRAGADRLDAACRAALTDTPAPTADPAVAETGRLTRPVGGRLTAREREVLALMAEGRTNRQIAEALVLSDKTVKRHLSNIFDKLGVSSRAAAVRSAFQAGLL